MESVDVAIIGAGMSGLVAAAKLHRAHPQLSIALLEASDRVGGRIYTDEEGTELGAAFIGPEQHRIVALIHDLGLSMYPVDVDGPQMLVHHGTRRVFHHNIPEFSLLVRLDVNHAMRQIDRDVATVPADEPHTAPRARELDTMTIEQYLRRLCWTEDAFHYLSHQLCTLQTTECVNLSALQCLWFIRNVGSLAKALLGESWKVKGGNSQLTRGLAARLPAGVLRLNSPVRQLDTSDPDAVTVRGMDFALRAKRVIFAVPPYQLGRVEFVPPLPATRTQELMHYPMGNVIKTFTYYPDRHWKPHLSGRVLHVGQDAVAYDIYDDSPIDSESTGVILGFIDGDAAGKYGRLTPSERSQLLAKQYAQLFRDDALLQPVRYKEKTFADEPWVGGCFFGVPRAGTLTTFERNWRQPMCDNRIFFAGTEAANEWMAYMEGAYEAGERAARSAMASLGVAVPPLEDYSEKAHQAAEKLSLEGYVAPISFAVDKWPSPGRCFLGGAVVGAATVVGALALLLRARHQGSQSR